MQGLSLALQRPDGFSAMRHCFPQLQPQSVRAAMLPADVPHRCHGNYTALLVGAGPVASLSTQTIIVCAYVLQAPQLFAYIATILKEYGGNTQAIEMYQNVTRAAPKSSSYMLNLVHVLEIDQRFEEAFERGLRFVGEAAASGGHVLGALRVHDVLELLSARGPVTELRAWSGSGAPPCLGEGERHEDDLALATATHQAVAFDEGYDFNLLGLLFALCKILYISGDLRSLPALVRLIGNEVNHREFSGTLVVNEYAYFKIVQHLVAVLPPTSLPRAVVADHEQLYVVGDSHSLACAWHVMEFRGKPCVLRPKLVTGCKCWHMRDESIFYTTTQLENSIAAIPQGSTVIFLFGEIDCREGLAQEVARCRYKVRCPLSLIHQTLWCLRCDHWSWFNSGTNFCTRATASRRA